jgi:hypothetical protein
MRFAALLVGVPALLAAAAAPASPIIDSGFEAGILDPWFQGNGTLDTPTR